MRIFSQMIHKTSNDTLGAAGPCTLLLALALSMPSVARASDAAKAFSTPEEAVTALGAAVRVKDQDALRFIFGPALEELENPDRVQADQELEAVAAAFDQKHRLHRESDTKYVLEIGSNDWPLPIPIVRRDGTWIYDTAAGKEELLNRRIGQNELAVLKAMRAYVDAQREYASRDRDGDEVLEYAQRLGSSPGLKDGLFWPPDLDGEISPLGPLVAQAQGEGYSREPNTEPTPAEPFHGYYFRILKQQGAHAPGGSYNYVINGNMIGGFALVAWPAEYGTSGVMTFIVNQQGRVYERDFGKAKTEAAAMMNSYELDSDWHLSPD
ncbi:MAG: DUF2950 domain-containing protein [Verrucomicrobiia bacterium]